MRNAPPGILALVLCTATIPSLTVDAAATPTEIVVRVLSKGAKFVGSSMGGALVTLRDADTGELLARGVTQGSTGSTDRLMRESHLRGQTFSSDGSAAFRVTLDLLEPTFLEVTALGPLGQRQAANRASVTQWVVPGKHLSEGDGILLELPGFSVDVLAPPAHVRLDGGAQEIVVRANVTMMCGCPLRPGGLWDSDAYEIEAIVRRDREPVATFPLTFAGATSQFEATWSAGAPGTYEIIVYAYDPASGNTGLDRTTVIVEE